MKKIIACMLAVAAICPVFAGCDLPEESLGELMGVYPESTLEATMPTQMQTPTTVPTEAPTEAPTPFEVGQQVFAVYQHEGGTGIRMGFVVAVSGDDVILTTAVPGSGEDGELMSYPIADCYADSADAWAAAGQEPME